MRRRYGDEDERESFNPEPTATARYGIRPGAARAAARGPLGLRLKRAFIPISPPHPHIPL
jgi:hypothetical protein